MRTPSRRSLLASLGAAASGLAGCTSEDPTPTTTETNTRASTETSTGTRSRTPRATGSTTEPPTKTTESADDFPMTGRPGGVEAFDDVLPGFLEQWGIPGATVAVMDGERLVFTRGYGTVGPDSDDAVHPDALFRLGSLSKPITAVSVLDLVEKGELSLDDRAVEILAELVPEDGPVDPRVEAITVRQLLTHTAGWSTEPVGFDPVFAPIQVAKAQETEPPASAETTVEFMLSQELGADPGTTFEYSNVGYCILGRIIEAVTGKQYERHVRGAILSSLGAGDMAIGATRKENLREGQVRYRSHGTTESPFSGEGTVPRPYGAGVLNEALDANGGWVGSAPDLLRFVRGIDGLEGVPDVLSAETKATMLARPDVSRWAGASQYYGQGWYVTPGEGGPLLWHNGSLPGSYAFLAHDRGSGRTLVGLFNGRSPDSLFGQFNVAAQRTLLGAAGAVESWPDRDHFTADS
ncbi:serine hydrolase domain-containing protein [Halorhabdus sp. BNX81]|uniref:serine hydrolase domain-containing protein n=1 Tax=Halorhabdus sp. BNX81 TaxID=2980181 RepID=UPI0023DD1ADF|nr:serine hydrolase domain-containing protein [Halorhabdus sp. BNX81]WEL22158.1 Beta-lactamase family protein [Halorhabdus sp. BNX81]